jgi:hypothetical protein
MSLGAARRLMESSSVASISRAEAEFGHSVSVAFNLPLDQTVRFLVTAGIFVSVY